MRSAILNHNLVLNSAIINANWAPSEMEMRFFTALLARIRPGELAGEEVCVPTREILVPGSRRPNKQDYECMANMQVRLVAPCLLMPPSATSQVSHENRLPLLAYVKKQWGLLRVKLSNDLLPYFAPSAADTYAPHEQLLKLTMPEAARIYWMMREHAPHGTLTLELRELAMRLGLPLAKLTASAFRIRKLEPVQQQLAATDLPITLSYLWRKATLHAVCFTLPPLAARNFNSDTEPGSGISRWLGVEGEQTFFHGLLVLLRFLAGGICAAAVATCAAG